MTSLSWLIYFADIVSALSVTSGILAFFIIIAFVFLSIMKMQEDLDVDKKVFKSVYKISAVLSVLFTVLAIATPSKNALYAIATVEIGNTVVSSPESKQIFDKSVKLLDKKLSEMLEENKQK